jgi:hypothetical protein
VAEAWAVGLMGGMESQACFVVLELVKFGHDQDVDVSLSNLKSWYLKYYSSMLMRHSPFRERSLSVQSDAIETLRQNTFAQAPCSQTSYRNCKLLDQARHNMTSTISLSRQLTEVSLCAL